MIKSLYDEELTGRCDKDKLLQGNEPGCWDWTVTRIDVVTQYYF